MEEEEERMEGRSERSCVAIKGWHAADHINEDLQLERSGRVGPVAARKLTASSSGENGSLGVTVSSDYTTDSGKVKHYTDLHPQRNPCLRSKLFTFCTPIGWS
ncbi:unnamed protein product [Pleuronectes platessa]|uniref:Uncharacterized protein n=1 Tax=Pleuronectes platessa TaxID=8262 RepID=A0A9N7V9E9_PLEPL|nr:unnamed protein product [Pleuronectes platessa]